ncbi:MAG: TatD family hydrolase [Planctomycetota bacterium]
MLTDTHCHLTSPELLQRMDAVLAAAAAAGVARIIQVAVNPDDARAAMNLIHARTPARADRQPGTSTGGQLELLLVAGIHPHEAAGATSERLAELRAILEGADRAVGNATRSVVGLGETGLDFHYDFAPRAQQEEAFRAQLALAQELKLPVVIHSRESESAVCDILADYPALAGRVVFHCFSGDIALARRALDLGCLLSYTGVVTFKKAPAIQAAARFTPPDRIMLETDAPYLTPEPVRKIRPNEPALLVHTARFVADLRGVGFEELAAQTTANAVRFFGLPEERA